jgi:hypothetical protein
MLKGLKQFVPQDVCLKCDGCCRFKEEKSSWRPNVSFNEGLPKKLYDQVEEGSLKTKVCQNGLFKCRFFNEVDNTCEVYQFRPFECQLYPFVLTKEDSRLALSVHLSCPFIQDAFDSAVYNDYVDYLKTFFADKDIMNFVSRNRSIAGDYADFRQELKQLFVLDV